MSETIMVQTTFSSENDALELAKAITKEKLTACSQIDGPIKSVYWWKDELETENEWRCTFKTSKRVYPRLENRIKALHPYETPEIIVVPITGGSEDYLNWVEEEVAKD